MTALFTRADAIREYLTGASTGGGSQDNPDLSIGHYPSTTDAQSLAIQISAPLSGVVIQLASGQNPNGVGYLYSRDSKSLIWQPPGSSSGSPVVFSGPATLIVEGPNPGQFLRIQGTPPFPISKSAITLTTLLNNVFGFDWVMDAQATAGENQYRATVIQNLSSREVDTLCRWLGELGVSQISNSVQLSSSGAGQIIVTSGSLSTWPAVGWCQIKLSGGSLREVVYYSSRTDTILTVPASGRGRFGTTSSAGANTDTIHAVPGLALAIDTNGAAANGSAIETIANQNTPPAGVTWNLGITKATGLQIGTLPVGTQVGIWMWREMPAGSLFVPNAYNAINTDFFAIGG